MARQFTPEKAVERYIKERKDDLADSTLYNYKSTLKQFVQWCDDQSEVEYIHDLDQFHISDFKLYKRDQPDMSATGLYNTMMSVRVFIRWCESKGLLKDMADNIMLPDRGRAARTETLDTDKVREILDYLDKYEYASDRHVQFALMWDTGVRLGALRSFDLNDYHSDEAYIELHHRPNEDTPLKNGRKSEREVNLHQWVADVVDDYIVTNRIDATDDYDREPLLTTRHGRAAKTTLRVRIRAITQPCQHGKECPIDRDPNDCEARHRDRLARCPDGVKPHSIRRSSITYWLNEGHAKQLVSDRMDVSLDVIDQHYDARNAEEKRQMRRDMFDMDE